MNRPTMMTTRAGVQADLWAMVTMVIVMLFGRISSSHEPVGRARLEMKHECDA